jgi:hypothetical protein
MIILGIAISPLAAQSEIPRQVALFSTPVCRSWDFVASFLRIGGWVKREPSLVSEAASKGRRQQALNGE